MLKITVEAYIAKNEFPKNTTGTYISMMKGTFQNFSEELYKSVYETVKMKNYCFAVRFTNPEFQKDKIILGDNKFRMYISTNDFSMAVDMYNAFLKIRNKPFALPDDNSITVKRVRLENHDSILKNEIFIKMLSPLLVKKHEGRKDYFYSWENDEFIPLLKQSVNQSVRELLGVDMSEREFEIVPYAPKKTVVNCFDMKVTANIGIYKLTGDLDILNFLYQTGIGCKRSAGFGMFEVI